MTIELDRRAPRSTSPRRATIPHFGARPLGRVIENEVKRPLGDELLFGELENGGQVVVDVEEAR